MNPSYFRIQLKKEAAVKRLCDWLGKEFKERRTVGYLRAVDACVDSNGQWKGSCVYVYENEGWTVFEDLMGAFSFMEAEDWKAFAKEDEFVFAAYNDAMLYAELIMVSGGVVTKKFLENFDMPEDNVNEGDGIADIEDWTDVAEFVDCDELVDPDEGEVLIF